MAWGGLGGLGGMAPRQSTLVESDRLFNDNWANLLNNSYERNYDSDGGWSMMPPSNFNAMAADYEAARRFRNENQQRQQQAYDQNFGGYAAGGVIPQAQPSGLYAGSMSTNPWSSFNYDPSKAPDNNAPVGWGAGQGGLGGRVIEGTG